MNVSNKKKHNDIHTLATTDTMAMWANTDGKTF
jgi:hypothetical protein